MYGSVPAMADVKVVTEAAVVASTAAACSRRAMPKSSTFARPSTVMMMFCGLRSQCTTPRSCACAIASATCAP
jgi:hypothetical protein